MSALCSFPIARETILKPSNVCTFDALDCFCSDTLEFGLCPSWVNTEPEPLEEAEDSDEIESFLSCFPLFEVLCLDVTDTKGLLVLDDDPFLLFFDGGFFSDWIEEDDDAEEDDAAADFLFFRAILDCLRIKQSSACSAIYHSFYMRRMSTCGLQ